jgi:hypothetical protein
MCVSLAPAHFSKTKGLAAETKRGRKIVHLLGYQNTVSNLSARRSGGFRRVAAPVSTGQGNAMFLPIPAKAGTMTEANVIDTSSCPNILKDMERAILPPVTRGGGRRGGTLGKGLPDSVRVFDHDIYTVVLASRAEDIPAALKLVPEHKRPALNKSIFEAYARWYPGWTFALCCFNTDQEADAKPLLWWYEPLNKDVLFFPALDAHDGNAPDLQANVLVDHAIIVSSHRMTEGAGTEVHYTDTLSEQLRALLPKHVLGRQHNQNMRQGDFVIPVKALRSGSLDLRRELPKGAK